MVEMQAFSPQGSYAAKSSERSGAGAESSHQETGFALLMKGLINTDHSEKGPGLTTSETSQYPPSHS
ncbi:MAG: hypothetical protein LBT32_07655, partial [Peptococcaceae bacterium]|nr:hypothetical protein [Peptococcaceae bacterium]